MTRIILVRHGRTSWHAEGRYVGMSDIPVDEVGRDQSRLVAERFSGVPINAVYSSPLSRCSELAEMVAEKKGIEPIIDDRLIEIDFGRWDGLDYMSIAKIDGETIARWLSDPASVTVPGGEPFREVQNRVSSWLEDAVSAAGGGTVFAASHGGPIRALISTVIGLPLSNAFRLSIDLASVSIVNHHGDYSMLELLNDTSHLGGK